MANFKIFGSVAEELIAKTFKHFLLTNVLKDTCCPPAWLPRYKSTQSFSGYNLEFIKCINIKFQDDIETSVLYLPWAFCGANC